MPTADDLRDAVDDLATLAAADLRVLWRDVTDGETARQALEELLPALVITYGTAAATVAADWYDEVRDEARVAGRFRAVPAVVDDQGTRELAGWAVGPLFDPEPDVRRAQVLAEGGLQRRIANAARRTVTGSVAEDRRAKGWQRSASGGCAFCQMLASRGAVYSRSTVDFASHDNCRCVAVPAWEGQPIPVKPYTPSARSITDADRARVRAYLRNNSAG